MDLAVLEHPVEREGEEIFVTTSKNDLKVRESGMCVRFSFEVCI